MEQKPNSPKMKKQYTIANSIFRFIGRHKDTLIILIVVFALYWFLIRPYTIKPTLADRIAEGANTAANGVSDIWNSIKTGLSKGWTKVVEIF